MPPPRTDSCASQVLLFTGDRRMPRWQYLFIYFFFFLILRAFVCDIAPHANLQIIESQGNNSRRLLCPLTTAAADAVILLKSTLAATQMRQRERKHRLENTLKAPALEPVVNLEAVGDFGQNNCYCSASSKCVLVQT